METTGTNWEAFGLVLVLLAVFGALYALVVHFLSRRGWMHGYTFLFVAGGVGVTVLGAGFVVGLEAALVLMACFTASGLPMVIESMVRHTMDAERARKVANGD